MTFAQFKQKAEEHGLVRWPDWVYFIMCVTCLPILLVGIIYGLWMLKN